jgi:RimJ/RimL family protein N-acetyltransferase
MISTGRLILRHLEIGDAPKLFAMSIEDGMRRWIPDQVYRDEAHAVQVIRALLDDPRLLVLGIEHAGILVGHVGLSPARASIEVGYAIEDAAQGRGFAVEAVRALTDWALADRPEILGIVAIDNTRSRRVLEKSGFVQIEEEPRRIVYRRAHQRTI